MNKRIKNKSSKEIILKENEEKNNKIEETFNNIDKKIIKCYENMKNENKVIENKEIKTLNQLLNRVHCRIKKDVQEKQIDYLNKIFEEEKNYALDK